MAWPDHQPASNESGLIGLVLFGYELDIRFQLTLNTGLRFSFSIQFGVLGQPENGNITVMMVTVVLWS